MTETKTTAKDILSQIPQEIIDSYEITSFGYGNRPDYFIKFRLSKRDYGTDNSSVFISINTDKFSWAKQNETYFEICFENLYVSFFSHLVAINYV